MLQKSIARGNPYCFKGGKAILCSLLVVFSFIGQPLKAQVATYYNFNQSSGTYTPGITGFIDTTGLATNTPASIFTTAWDDLTAIFRIPFDFTYNGILYPASTGRIGLDSDAWFTFSNGNPTMTGQLGGGSWVSISDHSGVYLFGTANNNGFAGFNCDLNNQAYASVSGVRTNGSTTITSISSMANIRVGTRLSGNGITNGTIVTSVAGTTITISSPATSNNIANNIVPNSSIYAFIRGTAPNREFVIQWTQAKRYGGLAADDINFQMILNEGNANPTLQTLQVIYGTSTSTDAANLETQVGLRGASSADFNARKSSTGWAATTAATVNTDLVRFSNTINPASGLTFTWSPCTVAPGPAGVIAGPSPVCPNTTQVYSITTVPGAVTYNWTYSGTGATFPASTPAPSNSIVFAPGATSGTLQVTPTNLCGSGTASTKAITVTAVTLASISYSPASYCINLAGSFPVTLAPGSPGGGTYAASPAGLTIVAGTGAITPSSSTAGTYTVTYTYTSSGCPLTATTTVTIAAAPSVTATATPSIVCTGGNSQLLATVASSGNYTVTTIPYASLSPSGSPAVVWSTSYIDDANSAAIPMPFPFTYYGAVIPQLYINSNGHIQLNATGVTPATAEQTLPDATTPNNVIALAWDDLIIDNTTNPGTYVRYFTNGVSPNQVFVVEYFNLRFLAGSSQNITGQIRLYQNDNHIEVAAGTVNDNGALRTKTLGIENSTGTLGVAPAGRNNVVWNVTNEAWAFFPPSGTYSYSWSPSTFILPGSSITINNPVASGVTGSPTYTVSVTNSVSGCIGTAMATVTSSAPLNGTYTVGIGGNYTTLTAAVNAYNNLCIGGPVIFSLIDNTYPSETFPIIINSNAYASSTNTLTIKPAATKTPLISGSSATSLIQLNGADYVTVDGSNAVAGTSRDLSITNTAASSNAVIWINSASASNGATNNTIKNSKIFGASNSGTVACILTGSGVTAGNDAEFPNNNNTIQNDTLYRAQNGIYARGNTSSLDQNWLITQNGIGSASVVADKMGFRGIAVMNSQNFNISKNTITGVTLGTSGFDAYGIALVLNINTGNIIENKVSDIKHTSVYGAHGIYLGATTTASNVTVLNNFIFDVAAAGFNGFTASDNGYGITLNLGGGYKIYFNTVVLNTSPSVSTTNHRAAALLVTSGVTTAGSIDLRNNIFDNKQAIGNGNSRYAVLSTAANTVYSNINYNGYYSAPSGNLLCKGSNALTYTTLLQVQTNLGGNANSAAGITGPTIPTYVSTTDYHVQSIAANAIATNLGTPISPITTDYDITTRNGLTPDIGADEWLMPNTGSWVGKTSIDWLVNTNWETNTIPDQTTDVTVTGGYTFLPTLVTTQAVRDMNVKSSSVTTIGATGVLQVFGNINATTSGVINGSNGTVEMKGAVAQLISANAFQSNNLKNLIIGNSFAATGVTLGGTLDIYRSLTFSATGLKLTTGNYLTLKSTATETAWLGNVTGKTIVDSARVERYIPSGINHGKSWQLLAVPMKGPQSVKASWQEGQIPGVVGANGYGTTLSSEKLNAVARGFDFYTPSSGSGAGGPSIKTYDPSTNTFIGIDNGLPGTNTSTLQIQQKKGYMVFVRGDRNIVTSAGANATTLRTFGKLYTATAGDLPPVTAVLPNKFETIGNPYASAIDFTLISRDAGVDNVFYIWDPYLAGSNLVGGYQTITGITGYLPTPGSPNYPSGTAVTRIQSGQAFFVHGTAGGNVSFTEAAKITGSQLVLRPAVSINNLQRQFLRLNLYRVSTTGLGAVDGNVVAFDNDFSNAFNEQDALKIGNASENIGIFSNEKLLAVEARKPVRESDTIFYNIANLRQDEYQFRFGPENMSFSGYSAWLVDRFLGTKTPISLSDSSFINFNIEANAASSAANRFYLVFKLLEAVPVSVTHISATRSADKEITVNWKVENETNIEHYELERSNNGRNFSKIFNKAPHSNNGGSAVYEQVDNDPLPIDNYYRVKALGNSGQVQYSAIVKVGPAKSGSYVSVYPNPVVDKTLSIGFYNMPAAVYQVKLVNKLGQVMYNNLVPVTTGTEVKSLPLGKAVATGTYQLSILGANGTKTTQQVVVE